MSRAASMLDFAVSGVVRRRGRNGAIGVGLALVVSLVTSVALVADALRVEYERGAQAMPDLTVQSLVAGRPALIDPSALAFLRERPGIRRIEPRVWGYLFVPALEANVTILGRGSAEADARVLSGRLPRAEREMALGATLAEALGVRLGDSMAIPASSGYRLLRVVGVFRASTALRTADVVLVTPEEARLLLGIPDDRVADVAVFLATPSEAGAVTAAIGEAIPGARVLDRQLLARTYALTFDARAGLLGAMLLPALAAFLLLAWERLTGMSESERREIGVLKAVGWDTRDVLVARMLESGTVALIGTLVGLLSAYLYVFVLGAPGIAHALFGWSRLHPPLALVPTFEPAQVLSVVALVVGPFVAVSVVPAFRASMQDPDAIVRGAS